MTEDIYKLERDTNLFCLTAQSFPEDIGGAHQRLHSLLDKTEGRNFFGVSYPGKDGKIIYKAAVEEGYPGEAEKYGCERFILKEGEYISTFIVNFHENLQSIQEAFHQLLSNPNIDPEGCCVEMYPNDSDIRCMVRLNPITINKS